MSYSRSNVGGTPDANQAEVVAAYREMGCSVFEANSVGFGFPDLVVGCLNRTELREVKTEEGELSPGQRVFVRDWRGSRVRIIRTRDEAYEDVHEIRARVIRESKPKR